MVGLDPGAAVRATLASGQVVEGVVHIYDDDLKTLVLAVQEERGQSFTVIRTKSAELEITPPANGPTKLPGPAVNMEEILRRERKAIQMRQKEAEKIGPPGTSQKIQALFDELDKIMGQQIEWRGESIVVMDNIVVQKPYEVINCTGGSGPALTRVKKILEDLRVKHGL